MTKIIQFPCAVSLKTVVKYHNAICCDSCDKWEMGPS